MESVYDTLGRPVAFRHVGEPDWTCTSYDARGRVTTVRTPAWGGEPARTTTTTYRANGDPYSTTLTDVAGTITTVVDALGRTVRNVDVWGVTTATNYDLAGRLISSTTTVAATGYASTSGYTYDDVGRLVEQTLDGLVIAVPTYSPDTDATDPGSMLNVSYPSGTGNGGNGTFGTLSYDALGRPSTLTWRQAGTNALIASDSVTRSIAGVVLSNEVDGTLTWTYSYDGAARLTRAVGSGHDFQYGYAPTGGCGANSEAGKNTNRTTLLDNGTTVATYCYDNADRLTSTTQTGYTGPIGYDGHGNTSQLAGESHSYDGANRHTGTSRAGVAEVTYQRDAIDRIVGRTETPHGGAPTAIRYGFTGSGDSSDITLTAMNSVLERIVILPGGVTYTSRGAASAWSYPNLHGDNMAIANNSGIKQGQTITYTPFGEALNGPIPDNLVGSLDNGWLGEHQRRSEHATGLTTTIQMGARPYNATLGRFLEVDPIEGGCGNDYVYVFGDPVNSSDLSGSWSCPRGWSIGGKAIRSTIRSIASGSVTIFLGAVENSLGVIVRVRSVFAPILDFTIAGRTKVSASYRFAKKTVGGSGLSYCSGGRRNCMTSFTITAKVNPTLDQAGRFGDMFTLSAPIFEYEVSTQWWYCVPGRNVYTAPGWARGVPGRPNAVWARL